MLTLAGSSPLLITYNDGSSHSFDLDDWVLLAAIEHGSSLYTEPDDGVEFAVLEWPEDLTADLDGQSLTLEEVSGRFCSFVSFSLRAALERVEQV